jgi:hypothetical protein
MAPPRGRAASTRSGRVTALRLSQERRAPLTSKSRDPGTFSPVMSFRNHLRTLAELSLLVALIFSGY